MESIETTYAEVYNILNVLGDKYKNKVPKKFIEFLDDNRNKDYSLKIDEKNYESINISRDALTIISILNLNYWVESEDEKQALIEKYKKNDEEFQEKINRYKDIDWLKSSHKENTETESNRIENEKINQSVEVESSLQVINENSIFYKIKCFIKNILSKWRK